MAGWLVILLLLAGGAYGVGRGIVPFLSPTRPVQARLLVVEGWLPDYAVEQALRYFRSQQYEKLVVTGTAIEKGSLLLAEKNYAQVTVKTLLRLGVPEKQIVALPIGKVVRDRTYRTALRVRDWLGEIGPVAPVDVFSLGPHSRRTWILYQMALGEKHRVGIVAGAEEEYDTERWWTTSQGVRTVIAEAIAYCYARLIFRPKPTPAAEELGPVTQPAARPNSIPQPVPSAR